MNGQLFIVFLSLLVVAVCDMPTLAQRQEFLEALNRFRSEVSPTNQPARWHDWYAQICEMILDLCGEDDDVIEGASYFLTRSPSSNYLLTALNYWVQKGKEDMQKGCKETVCKFYTDLMRGIVSRIACGYKNCSNLAGVYVVCRYDYFGH